MRSSKRRKTIDRLLIDMNTQCDFLLPKGAVPVANRAQVLPNIRRIMNWGRVERVPVISSLECHRRGEPVNGLPAFCLDQSQGQRKLPFTLLPRRIVLHGDNTLDVPLDPFRRYRQVIFTKRGTDFLTNPKADRLINSVCISQFIVFGTLVETSIKAAVLALIARHRTAIVVRDACGYWCPSDAELSMRQMEAKGAILTTTDELISGHYVEKLNAIKPPAYDAGDEPVYTGNGRRSERTRPMSFDVAAADPKGRVVKSKPNGKNGNGRSGRKNKPCELAAPLLAARKKHREDRVLPG